MGTRRTQPAASCESKDRRIAQQQVFFADQNKMIAQQQVFFCKSVAMRTGVITLSGALRSPERSWPSTSGGAGSPASAALRCTRAQQCNDRQGNSQKSADKHTFTSCRNSCDHVERVAASSQCWVDVDAFD